MHIGSKYVLLSLVCYNGILYMVLPYLFVVHGLVMSVCSKKSIRYVTCFCIAVVHVMCRFLNVGLKSVIPYYALKINRVQISTRRYITDAKRKY